MIVTILKNNALYVTKKSRIVSSVINYNKMIQHYVLFIPLTAMQRHSIRRDDPGEHGLFQIRHVRARAEIFYWMLKFP